MSSGTGRQGKAFWRERVRQIGLEGVIREEMTRLGFWPPNEEVARNAASALATLQVRYEELGQLRTELQRVESELGDAQNVTKMLAEIRRRRIERVRAQREVRRVQRAQQEEEHKRQDQEWRQRTLPFLGRGVSGGLRYEGGDFTKLEKLGLPRLETASDVAAAIGITERELAWLTYHRGAAAVDHYHRFTIPKRHGGLRVISSPKRRLRTAQTWVLEQILSKIPVEEAAMAFRPGRSITDNAAAHAGKAVVLRIDLKDFFPSIHFKRVKGLFESFGYNEGVATLLALLATEAPRVAATFEGEKRFVSVGQRQLPQGACTSPALTNVLSRKLDRRLTGLAASLGFTYSRYADDLVFSHAERNAPVGMLLGAVRSIIENEGFQVNEAKTVVMRPQHRQAVTGLVVNQTPRISRRDLRRFRAFLHHCETEGLEAMSQRLGKSAGAYAAGYLSFIHMVNPEQEERIQLAHPWITRWRERSE
jgi:RNA-directed DNA polymerase